MQRIEPILGPADQERQPRQVAPTRRRPRREVSPEIFAMHGRLSRSWYWLYHLLFNLLLPIPFYAAAWRLFSHDLQSLLLGLGSILFVHCWLAISLVVRRLHDLNLSGWWYLLGLLLPLLTLISLYLLLRRGQPAENRFGPPCPPMTPLQRKLTLILTLTGITAFTLFFVYYGADIEAAKSLMAAGMRQLWQ